MGTMVVKVTPDPTDDRWVLWSTVVEDIATFGTRDEVRKYLLWHEPRDGSGDAAVDQRFERAAASGSSGVRPFDEWAFGTDGGLVRQHWLTREQFVAWCGEFFDYDPAHPWWAAGQEDAYEDRWRAFIERHGIRHTSEA